MDLPLPDSHIIPLLPRELVLAYIGALILLTRQYFDMISLSED